MRMRYYEIDRLNAYIKHRHRVECAKSIIDHYPPLLHVGNFCRFTKLKEDVLCSLALDKRNADMLVAINRTARTRGVVDSFRTTENFKTPNFCKISRKLHLLEEVEKHNMILGKRILCIKPDLNTRLSARFLREIPKKLHKPFQYPAQIMAKYSCIKIPREPKLLKKFLRPKIWFVLEVKDIRPLGRVIIELYTEAAPQVVLEFVRLCFGHNKERINFVRLFPGLWLEGEISLDSRTLIQKNIEFDKRPVDHGELNGVLSFTLDNIKLYEKGFLNFTMSFKPLRVLNGRRIGFGHVCKGFKVLNSIQDYGTKNGKPTKEIIVSNCGVLY